MATARSLTWMAVSIAGLYAAGNAMGSAHAGMTYGGAGGTPRTRARLRLSGRPTRCRGDVERANFTGKVALVTGAAGGMGRATAQAFCAPPAPRSSPRMSRWRRRADRRT